MPLVFTQKHKMRTVGAVDFFVTEEFGQRLYDSCKDVKFAAMNTRAMDFIGGGAINYTGTVPPFSLRLFSTRCSYN